MAQGNGQLFNLANNATNIIGPDTNDSSPQHYAPLQTVAPPGQQSINLFPPLQNNPPAIVEYLPRLQSHNIGQGHGQGHGQVHVQGHGGARLHYKKTKKLKSKKSKSKKNKRKSSKKNK